MKLNNVIISGIGHHLPETIISSNEIEQKLAPLYQRLKLPEGRLELMTGIKERRVWPAGTRPSDLSTKAAQNALSKSKVKASEIDLLIHASVCRDFLEPATASVVHANLGLSAHCQIFDLSNACLGVINAILVASNMIETGVIKNAMIVSGENSGPLLEETIQHLLNDSSINKKDIKKYIANLTIGSAAVCYLLSNKEQDINAPKLLSAEIMTDSSANHLCQGSGNTHSLMMQTDSENLLHAGITLAQNTWNKFIRNNENFDWALTHQVGVAHEQLLLESLNLLGHKTFKTYPFLGNTGSAALPITLALLAEQNSIKKGEKIALLGIGSGLSSIMLGVEW